MNLWSDFMGNFDWKTVIYIGIMALLAICFVVVLVSLMKPKKKKTETREEAKNTMQELLNAMQEDLDKKKANPISSFETEQEEKAIISYQQLVELNRKKQEEKENVDINETIEIKPVVIPDNDISIDEIKKEIVEEVEDVTTTDTPIIEVPEVKNGSFVNSEVISPIFGRVNTNPQERNAEEIKNDQYLYRRKTIEPEIEVLSLEQEVKPEPKKNEPNEDFLQALKELRKNL